MVEVQLVFVLTLGLYCFSAPGMEAVELVLDILSLDPLVMVGGPDILSWSLQDVDILSLSPLV